ncbi:hypothetical protein AMS68_003533 [Peltaster fructicola]|uniref:DUF7707 domain-containing protein n=1 Tax=Peltaster fructicola TaxID=286661 RepID=A0A6H0XTL5_9PEZI|nr:hypothetical protein AMS68_003533 [Peltaster fructicola]
MSHPPTPEAQPLYRSISASHQHITMLYSTLAIAAAFAGLASAQNYTTSGTLNVTASQFPLALRQSWCTGERNNCPVICGGRATSNDCDPNNLSYLCVCSDGSKPNVSDYMETLPFYICEQWIGNCVKNHPNDVTGQAACQSVVCGMKNATNAAAVGGSSASASASAASTAASTGAATTGSMTTTTTATAAAATSATTTSSRAAAATAFAIAKNYGTPILAAGMFAAFGLAL